MCWRSLGWRSQCRPEEPLGFSLQRKIPPWDIWWGSSFLELGIPLSRLSQGTRAVCLLPARWKICHLLLLFSGPFWSHNLAERNRCIPLQSDPAPNSVSRGAHSWGGFVFHGARFNDKSALIYWNSASVRMARHKALSLWFWAGFSLCQTRPSLALCSCKRCPALLRGCS